jgi:hypothetical protein
LGGYTIKSISGILWLWFLSVAANSYKSTATIDYEFYKKSFEFFCKFCKLGR